MILLTFLFSVIENIVMSYTLKKCFDIHSYFKITLTTILLSLCMTYIKDSSFPNFFIGIFPIIGYTIFLTIELKNFHFSYFAFPAILVFLLLFSETLGYIISVGLSEVTNIAFAINEHFIYLYSLISNLLYIILCWGFYYLVQQNRDNIKIKDSLALGTAMVVLIIMFSNLLQSVILANFTIYTSYSLLFEFIILSLLIFYLYANMHKQEKENLEINKKLLRIQYQNQMYSIVNQLNSQISSDKHMMIYNLMKIKHMIHTDSKEQIQQFLDKEIDRMTKYKYISSTDNILFDYAMTLKINELLIKNIDVKTVFMINKNNELLEDETLIDYILNTIEHILTYKINNLQIFIQETSNQYIIFKLIYKSPLSIEDTNIFNTHIKVKKINYKKENLYQELSILLS